MKALYRLSRRIAGFDFFSWLMLAQAAGATEVVFDPDSPKTNKWPEREVLKRFESILLPGPALAGMPVSIGKEGEDFWETDMRYLIAHVRDGKPIQRLRSVLPPAKERYTVTIRRTERRPERNSNEPAWRAFAAEIGARVIEDYDVEPIGLHERMALYAGAEMNFFLCNGPLHICGLSEYPLMCFRCDQMVGALEATGIARGEQYPWHRPNQRLIYEPDELPVLRRHFKMWRETVEA
ncbi:MAG: hypothetical protein U1A72_15520 [Sulfuritalea sp.]|nr:hypothetical protein [Sulfuritalea sp.]